MNHNDNEQDILGSCWYRDGARLDRITTTRPQCYATYGQRVILWEAFSSASLDNGNSATCTEPSIFNLVSDLIDHLDEEEQKNILGKILHNKTK